MQVKVKIGTAKSHIKNLLNEERKNIWQKTWDNKKTKGYFTHKFELGISAKRLWKNYILMQLLTNHGISDVCKKLPAYFVHIRYTPRCPLYKVLKQTVPTT